MALSRPSANPKQRAGDLATREAAKQRASFIVDNFSHEKLRADMKLGPGKMKKGARHYTVRDLVSLKKARGGRAMMEPIVELQQTVLKLYT